MIIPIIIHPPPRWLRSAPSGHQSNSGLRYPLSNSIRRDCSFCARRRGRVIVTPLAGRAGDRGWTRSSTIAPHLTIVGAFALTAWAGDIGKPSTALAGLSPGTERRFSRCGRFKRSAGALSTFSRRKRGGHLDGLFVGLFFLGGAVGAAVAGFTWAAGWSMICIIGAGLGLACLLGRPDQPTGVNDHISCMAVCAFSKLRGLVKR
jgi:hypothetical protein